jgi:hypothetical protein
VLFNEKAIEDTKDLNYVMVQRYEDLCENPVSVAKQLMEFSGLSWSAQTENFTKLSVTQEHNSYYSVYKDPSRSANKWRDKLPESDVKYITDIVVGTKAGELYKNMY